VSGKVIPLKLNPVPLAVIWEIVRAVPPEFVSFSVSVDVLPVVTFPKPRLVGLAASWLDVAPVPDRGTEKLGFDPLELIARVPVTFPAVCGANDALKVTL
jgi:hypothetical protein